MHSISELLLARASDSGSRVFLSFKGKETTYGQLLNGVKEFAGALSLSGVQVGSRVGFMLPASLEHMQLYLATAWLGATAVPFSGHMKAAGVELQLNSSKPAVLVASRVHADAIRLALSSAVHKPRKILWLEDGNDGRDELSANALLRDSHAISVPVKRGLDDALAINYTSGTTGAPKGAVLSERYYWTGAKNAAILSEATRDDTYFMWEPFYHIAAWMTVLMALQNGFRIHMVERFSASRLWDQIAQAQATKFHYLGGLVNIMLAQPVVASERDNTVSIAWGGACPTDSWRRFEDRFGLKVREGYGLSEGQNFTHVNLEGIVGSIGKPIAELDSWVIDESGAKVGPGEVGELVLKPKVPKICMSGYFGEPEKTADVLRKDGCIYTGDLASFDENGNYYFKGRKKDALRRRGENVSAWEVERVLNAAPGVEESAVIGVASPLGEQEIFAAIKLQAGATPDAMSIARFCDERLAYYQVPRYIQFVEEFPRGPTQRIKKGDIMPDLSLAWDGEKAGFKAVRSV